ncbi:MAG: AarF/ABC1/UbiB kinase family protein, partial [Pseudomonadota bacterium]|nr:AarF/ABC1/UbiB kinase family protein [Pseudomonadota bacterium]
FNKEASAAASLGQVHRAVHPDGKNLACKLHYPDMKSAVEADLKQLRLVFSIYGRYDKAVDFSQIHQEVSDRLREELNYELERKHMDLYRAMLSNEPGVHVPLPLPQLSSDRLLTMTWLDGVPLLELVDAELEMRNRVAENMFRAWYVPFYYYGTIHGDPHLGNYSVCEDGSVNLMDFGCIRIFNPLFVGGVIDLYRAIETGNRDLAVHAYETWGFSDLSNELLDTLNIWAEFVYGPLLEDRPRKIQETDGTMYGAQVAGKVHAELRRLGGVTPPREFVLMDRAAIGLGSVFLHLKAEINWHRMFHDLIGDFDVKSLAKRQVSALEKVGISAKDRH